MARPIRLDYPGTFYHVLSRGNERREIFYDRRDYLRFLGILAKVVKRFKPQVRILLKRRDIRLVVFRILKRLGEKKPEQLISSKRRTRRPTRDIAIYILGCFGVYTNKELGEFLEWDIVQLVKHSTEGSGI